ncbi:phytanoyl-CoA dioxygenase family protein [Streptomyces flaveolus]|uniref:phytanoyl-CoA dioxygenase family protein n=1 Tax=Streptomyces flaveolus TaxID=67297 RepID=UPI0033AB52D4
MDFVTIDDPSVKSRLERDGVVLIDGLLSKDEVAETRAQLERYEKEVLPDVPRVHYEFHPDGVLRNMTEIQRYDEWFNRFGNQDRFFDLFRGVVDWDPALFYLETFPKRPGCKPLRMHQELFAGPVDPPHYLHLWIALDDVTNDNSGMVFYRGSHRFGLAPHIFHPDGLPEVQPELLERIAHLRVEPDIPAGSAALFDGGTIHGSKANITDRRRLSLVVAVRGKDTVVHGDLDIFASIITRFYREEIGVAKCSAEDDFYSLGGDEPARDRVLKRIVDYYGVELAADQLDRRRTPKALAEELIELTGWHELNT